MTTPEILSTLKAIEANLTRTPTAFRWTPAMSAIWPKDYRPTMSGLLAMWEAMHEAAEYSGFQDASEDDAAAKDADNYEMALRKNTAEDGWIMRYAGDVMPEGRVEFLCADGYRDYGAIPNSWWEPYGNKDDRIVKWRRK